MKLVPEEISVNRKSGRLAKDANIAALTMDCSLSSLSQNGLVRTAVTNVSSQKANACGEVRMMRGR